MVIKPFLLLSLAAEYRYLWWVWSTVVGRPSEVYDTQRQTKLTVQELISRSRDVAGAHQNLNGSRDLTTPLSGMVCHPWASTYYLWLGFAFPDLFFHSRESGMCKRHSRAPGSDERYDFIGNWLRQLSQATVYTSCWQCSIKLSRYMLLNSKARGNRKMFFNDQHSAHINSGTIQPSLI